MTDNEIKKALECCVTSEYCVDCPCLEKQLPCPTSDVILDYINRLEAENENLEIELKAMRGAANSYKAENERLISGKCVYLSDDETTEYCVEGICPKYKTETQIKAEARKEFIEMVKRRIFFVNIHNCNEPQVKCIDLKPEHIDNLFKELVGEE